MMFHRLLSPLGHRHIGAVAAVLLVSSAPHHSASSFQCTSFKVQHSTATATTSSSFPAFNNNHNNIAQLKRPSSLSLYSNNNPSDKKKYDIDITSLSSGGGGSANDEEVVLSSPSPKKKMEKSSSLAQDVQSIITLVGAQSLLVPISIVVAKMLDIPNRGLGAGFAFTSSAMMQGLQWTVPLFAVAGIMRIIEPYSEALQGVTKATQRSVLAVMGKRRRPIFAILVSILLGAVAGWGEEWLFRGVFQTALTKQFSANIALAVSGTVFGLLHAVTPVYALLAAAASIFFGYLYNISNNLAVPMICHAVYDVGALLWAHYGVTGLSEQEQDEILQSGPGAPILDGPLTKQ